QNSHSKSPYSTRVTAALDGPRAWSCGPTGAVSSVMMVAPITAGRAAHARIAYLPGDHGARPETDAGPPGPSAPGVRGCAVAGGRAAVARRRVRRTHRTGGRRDAGRHRI